MRPKGGAMNEITVKLNPVQADTVFSILMKNVENEMSVVRQIKAALVDQRKPSCDNGCHKGSTDAQSVQPANG